MSTRVAFASSPGGVMTTEVGAISGALEVWLAGDESGPIVKVAYVGAADEYTVKGSRPGRGATAEQLAVVLATDPGPDEFGNPRASQLS